MASRAAGTAVAFCGGAAALVLIVGFSQADPTPPTRIFASSSVIAGPPSPAPRGGALPVQPAGGGGGCLMGLNCGCIAAVTCPKPHPLPPGLVGDPKHTAPAPVPQQP